MKALVLGGTGFVGSALLDHLLTAGDEVVAGVRRRPEWLRALPVELRDFDLGQPSTFAALVADVDVVYHLAWAAGPRSQGVDPSLDVEGTRRLAEAVSPGTRLVFLSSGGAVYGSLSRAWASEEDALAPCSPYGTAKRDAEGRLAEVAGLDRVVLRIGNAYGPARAGVTPQGVVAAFLARVRAGQPLEVWGAGDPVRDYVHLDDVVRAIRAAGTVPADRLPAARTLNVGTGRGTSLRELVALLGRLTGRPVGVDPRPGSPAGVARSVLRSEAARRALQWRAEVSLEDGLRRLLEAEARRPVPRCG